MSYFSFTLDMMVNFDADMNISSRSVLLSITLTSQAIDLLQAVPKGESEMNSCCCATGTWKLYVKERRYNVGASRASVTSSS